MKYIIKYLFLYLVGSFTYFFIEVFWRGYSHWTMLILGGICFVALGLINIFLKWETPLWIQCVIGGFIITFLEFITGCIINLWLGWDVWDYSSMSFNLLGQICFPYFILWIFLSAIGIIVDDYLRYWIFKEDKPHYTLF